jgi:hypothetical protein
MMGWPWARRSAATAEESTPPDMATAMVSLVFWGALGIVFPSSIFAFFVGFLSYPWHWRDMVALALK